MQPEQKHNETGVNSGNQSELKVCPQCGAPMPGEMRFCRSCGQRLGEGPAEYTETVRYPNGTAAANGRHTPLFTPGTGAPIAQQTIRGLGCRRRRLGFTGMTWIWIALGLFFASGGAMSLFRRGTGLRRPRISANATRSYFGIDGGFESTNGGATFSVATPPDGPADKAGLLGGDIITSFDGRPVKDENDMTTALRQTPIGKTVEVVYLRDGETKKTQLTTVSKDELDRLTSAYGSRPQGHLGFDDGDAERVQVPGLNIYGVQLNDVSQNGPADIAGIKKGDIVIEFGGVPIRTVRELVSRDHRTIPYSTVKIVVMRGGERVEIPVKLGKE